MLFGKDLTYNTFNNFMETKYRVLVFEKNNRPFSCLVSLCLEPSAFRLNENAMNFVGSDCLNTNYSANKDKSCYLCTNMPTSQPLCRPNFVQLFYVRSDLQL